jgi:hypothetical protein
MANGLINLQTDLKSLRYGSDKPYITKNIGEAPGSQIGLEVQTRIDDTSRIAQMLIDKPGIKYLLHEAELQQIDIAKKIKNRGNKTIAGAVLGQLGNTLVGTAKILGSTLAQVPVDGTGLHFVKGFRTDTYLQPTGGNNASKFAQFFGAGGVEGAPLALEGKPIEGVVDSRFGKVSSTSGEYKVYSDAEGELSYNGKVFNGQELKDYDEVKNTKLPKDQYSIAKDYAKLGKVIPINSSSLGPKDPLVKTKLQQSKAGSKQVGTLEGLGAGSVFGTPVYSPDNTFTGTSAEDASLHAQGGTPISTNSSQGTVPETTATSSTSNPQSSIKSTSHRGIIKGDTQQDNPGNLQDNKYSKAKHYKKPFVNPSENKTAVAIPATGDKGDVNGDLFQSYNSDKQYKNAVKNDKIQQQLPPTTEDLVKNQSNVNTVSSVGIQEAKKDGVGMEKFVPNRDKGTLVFGTQTIQDFRDPNSLKGTLYSSADKGYENIPKEDYKKYAKETRVGLGAQGKLISRIDYNAPTDPEVLDKLNALDLSRTNPDGVAAARDFAKLYFEVLTPDNEQGVFIHFRALLDGLDDSFNADWQSHKYVGRAEDFFTYGGFSRDINFSFKIAAATRSEMKPLYRKMVYLASTTAPTYGDSAFMRGTVVKLTLGSYLTQVPGVLTSVKYSWKPDYPWELAMKSPESGESDVQELPMVMDCSVTFKPIHNFAPQTGLYHYITSKNTNHPGSAPFFAEAEEIN